jgi:hypothetical protein
MDFSGDVTAGSVGLIMLLQDPLHLRLGCHANQGCPNLLVVRMAGRVFDAKLSHHDHGTFFAIGFEAEPEVLSDHVRLFAKRGRFRERLASP